MGIPFPGTMVSRIHRLTMKILHLIPNLSGGGAEQQLSYLAPELVRLGHEVHLAYSREGPYKPEMPGVVLHRLKSSSNYDTYLLWQLLRIIRSIKPDIIHTWIIQMDILGGIASKINGISWILREPSSAMAYSKNWKNRFRNLLGTHANAIVSNSIGGDVYWGSKHPHGRRFIIPNGLPAQEIDKVVAALPPELIEIKSPIILYVGRLTSDDSAAKNLEILIEALAYVRKKQAVIGILCGNGPQRFELEALSHKLGLTSDIHFLSYLPATSVWALMKKASIYISLSAYEGCPNTVMEAMACSCPVILSDIPAHREILNESCALFVDPSSSRQTAETILRALDDIYSSKVRAQIAKQKTQDWLVTKMAKEYEKVYEEMG